jgi:hypothetical protein
MLLGQDNRRPHGSMTDKCDGMMVRMGNTKKVVRNLHVPTFIFLQKCLSNSYSHSIGKSPFKKLMDKDGIQNICRVL